MCEINLGCASLDDAQRSGSLCDVSSNFLSLTLNQEINQDREQVQWEI
jgi:hypothetical protein